MHVWGCNALFNGLIVGGDFELNPFYLYFIHLKCKYGFVAERIVRLLPLWIRYV